MLSAKETTTETQMIRSYDENHGDSRQYMTDDILTDCACSCVPINRKLQRDRATHFVSRNFVNLCTNIGFEKSSLKALQSE